MTFARTKIQPPRPRAAFVERGDCSARLADALLDAARSCCCARRPAMARRRCWRMRWRAGRARRALAWVSADAGDDLQRLLECMLAALEPYDPPWRTAPEALITGLGRGARSTPRKVAAEIINTLDACDVPHGVIVFDDVHRVEDPAFFRFIDQLIERRSPRWTLALTSRTKPPLALARLRAADELAEFRQGQLQFARADAHALAAQSGLGVAAADRLFDPAGHTAGPRACASASAPYSR